MGDGDRWSGVHSPESETRKTHLSKVQGKSNTSKLSFELLIAVVHVNSCSHTYIHRDMVSTYTWRHGKICNN